MTGTEIHITDDDINAAIDRHADPEHPDALTVEGARDMLDRIQQSIENHRDLWQEMVEEETVEVVYENSQVTVFADHSEHVWGEELDAADVEGWTDRRIIKSLHYTAARKYTDYSWSVSSPFVYAKP